MMNYYWAHQIYIILSILGPPRPPYSAPIVLTAIQVYICHHQMAVNEIAQHRTETDAIHAIHMAGRV